MTDRGSKGRRRKRSASARKKKSRKPAVAVVAAIPKTKWSREAFLALTALDATEMKHCGVPFEELAAIHDDHDGATHDLRAVANYVSDVLSALPQVHTVRVRIKNPVHLIRKVVRKSLEKGEPISFHAYRTRITDLIGIRALHLYKEDWLPIHDFISSHWELLEQPLAYVRDGDHPLFLKAFEERGCQVTQHPKNYRSVHYVLSSAPSKSPTAVEVQVRTIFEEAWSEVDHRINYPATTPYPTVGFFLQVFNRLAGMADEMGSFLQDLVSDLGKRDAAAAELASQRDEALQKVDDLVAKVQLKDGERKELQRELEELRKKSQTMSPFLANVSPQLGMLSGTTITSDVGNLLGSTDLTGQTWQLWSGSMSSPCMRCGKLFSHKVTEIRFQCDECAKG